MENLWKGYATIWSLNPNIGVFKQKELWRVVREIEVSGKALFMDEKAWMVLKGLFGWFCFASFLWWSICSNTQLGLLQTFNTLTFPYCHREDVVASSSSDDGAIFFDLGSSVL